jgi:hypothetical protein
MSTWRGRSFIVSKREHVQCNVGDDTVALSPLVNGHDVNAVMSTMAQNINKATRSLSDWHKLDKFLRVAVSVRGSIGLLKPRLDLRVK